MLLGRVAAVCAVAAVTLALAPASAPAARKPCTKTVSSTAAAESAVSRARGGTTVCLADGGYGSISLNARKSSLVTLRARNPGAATIGEVSLSGRNLRIRAFVIHGEVTVRPGASRIAVERNAISQGDYGVFLYGDNGTISDVRIAGNRITRPNDDAIRLHEFRGVRIVRNEIRDVVETGSHSDVLQTVHGGAGLIFAHNYVHDLSGAQGFFVKDGAVTNVTIEENLMVRDEHANGYPISFYDVTPDRGDPFYTGHGAVVRRNTIWDDDGAVGARGGGNRDVLVTDNLFQKPFQCESGSGCRQAGNRVGGRPAFAAPRRDDFRLRSRAAGVTWRPGDRRYGP